MGGHRAGLQDGRDPLRLRGAAQGRLRRHPGDRPKKSEERGNDGWIAALVDYFACRYHWSYREILWEVPLSALSLLRRQEYIRQPEQKIFPLSEIEKIDDGQ